MAYLGSVAPSLGYISLAPSQRAMPPWAALGSDAPSLQAPHHSGMSGAAQWGSSSARDAAVDSNAPLSPERSLSAATASWAGRAAGPALQEAAAHQGAERGGGESQTGRCLCNLPASCPPPVDLVGKLAAEARNGEVSENEAYAIACRRLQPEEALLQRCDDLGPIRHHI